jgi:histidine ammonia-lyase
LKLGAGTSLAYEEVRKVSPVVEDDREFYRDIEAVEKIVRNGSVLAAVERRIRLR